MNLPHINPLFTCLLSILFLVCGFAPSFHPEKPFVSVRGSLVVFVPTKDGMIVAADSRSTLFENETYCDGVDKVFPLRNHPRSLIAMAGSEGVRISSMSSLSSPHADACALLKNSPKIIDFRDIAQDYLATAKEPINEGAMRGLEATLTRRIDSVLPDAGLSEPILSFAFSQYMPSQKAVVSGAFDVGRKDARKSEIERETFRRIDLTDDVMRSMTILSKTDCLRQAFSPQGRLALGKLDLQAYDAFFNRKPAVYQASADEGAAFARGIITGTVVYSDTYPALKCGVGGPIKIYRLDSHTKPVRIE